MSNANIIRSATSRAGLIDPDAAGEQGLIFGAPGDPTLESGFGGQSFVYQAVSQSFDDLLYSSTSISAAFDKQASFDTLLWDVEPTDPGGSGPQTPFGGTTPATVPDGPQTPFGDPPTTTGTGSSGPFFGGWTPANDADGPQTPGGGTGTGTPPTGQVKEVVAAVTPPPAPLTKAELLAAVADALGVADAVVESKPPQTSASLAFDTSAASQAQITSESLLLASPDPLGLF